MTLKQFESGAKIFALVGIPILVAVIPTCVSSQTSNRELSLEYLKLAIGILENPENDSELRVWATGLLNDNTPASNSKLPASLMKRLEEGKVSIQLINSLASGEYINVELGRFVDLVVGVRHLEKNTLMRFLEGVSGELEREITTHDDRWDIHFGEGRLFVFHTRDLDELSRAVDQIRKALDAIRDGRNIPGATITVRSNEKFYDINGLSGLGSRVWIGLDFR